MRLVLIAAALAAVTGLSAPAFAQSATEAAAIEEFKRGQASANAKTNDETIRIMTGVIDAAKLPKEWQPYPYFYRGQAYRRTKKYVEALADFDKALAIKPDLGPAHFETGMAYQEQEKYKQAIKAYDEAIKISPDNFEYIYSRCVSKSWAGDNAGAREDCRKAVTINDKSVDAWLTLGRAHEDLGQLDKAEECYKKVLTMDAANKSAKEGLDFIAEKRKAIKAGGG